MVLTGRQSIKMDAIHPNTMNIIMIEQVYISIEFDLYKLHRDILFK